MLTTIFSHSWDTTRKVFRGYFEDGISDLAAAVTFYTVFAIPAGVLAFVSALGWSNSFLGESLAAQAQRVSLEFVEASLGDDDSLTDAVNSLFDQPSAGLLTVGLVLALWAMSRGFAGLIRALDDVYDVTETRSWWRLRITATLMAIAVLGGLGLMLFALSQGIPTWVLAPAAIAGLTTLFHSGPSHKTPWLSDLPGGVLTTVGWLVSLKGFEIYVGLTAGGNQVLGTVGAGLVVLTLLYIVMTVLLIGAELNAVLGRGASNA